MQERLSPHTMIASRGFQTWYPSRPKGAAMDSGFPASLIRCRHCGAREVELISRLTRNALVRCSDCGEALWTWGEFLTLLEEPTAPALTPGGR